MPGNVEGLLGLEEAGIPKSPLEDSILLALSTGGFVQGRKEIFMSSHIHDLCMSVWGAHMYVERRGLFVTAASLNRPLEQPPEQTSGFHVAPVQRVLLLSFRVLNTLASACLWSLPQQNKELDSGVSYQQGPEALY